MCIKSFVTSSFARTTEGSVLIKFIHISMFHRCCACCALSWAQQAETGSFYELMVDIWTKI